MNFPKKGLGFVGVFLHLLSFTCNFPHRFCIENNPTSANKAAATEPSNNDLQYSQGSYSTRSAGVTLIRHNRWQIKASACFNLGEKKASHDCWVSSYRKVRCEIRNVFCAHRPRRTSWMRQSFVWIPIAGIDKVIHTNCLTSFHRQYYLRMKKPTQTILEKPHRISHFIHNKGVSCKINACSYSKFNSARLKKKKR